MKYVLLRNRETLERFFSDNTRKDPTKLDNGHVAYDIIGYADTIAEAQTKLYGRSYIVSD